MRDLIIRVSPLHCFLKETEEQDTLASDEEAIEAFQLVSKNEGFVSPHLSLRMHSQKQLKLRPN